MLEWSKLLNEARRKDKHSGVRSKGTTKGARTETERDYDRILFATPTRRLADKTQVFPMDPSDSIRTRLTHSIEVSNLARSIGNTLAFEYPKKVFGTGHEALDVKRRVPALLAAIGLAHDLGNPPFGHQGEVAMKVWFRQRGASSGPELPNLHADFDGFDGNPQTFRLLTKLQILNDNFGLNLTYGTLAALVKYPSLWDSTSRGGYEKFGIFESEREVIEDVWEETGLAEGVRHPLTYIMEACDDIAYAVIDAEDTVKKGYASFYDLMQHLKHYGGDPVVADVIAQSEEKNDEYRKDDSLSSSELNEISMQMFRVYAIYQLIDKVTAHFISVCESILNLDAPEGLDLVKASEAGVFCSALKEFDIKYAFKNKAVLRLELFGHNYITSTMDMLWAAIREPNSPFARYARHLISENYRRVYKTSTQLQDYRDCQLLCDSVAGMTDKYLVGFHDELKPLFDGLS